MTLKQGRIRRAGPPPPGATITRRMSAQLAFNSAQKAHRNPIRSLFMLFSPLWTHSGSAQAEAKHNHNHCSKSCARTSKLWDIYYHYASLLWPATRVSTSPRKLLAVWSPILWTRLVGAAFFWSGFSLFSYTRMYIRLGPQQCCDDCTDWPASEPHPSHAILDM